MTNDARTRALSRRVLLGALGLPWIVAATASSKWPLWSVERDGVNVFLMGETPRRQSEWKDSEIETLASRCEVVLTETNHEVHADVQSLIDQYGVANSPLAERLDKRDMERVSLAATRSKTPIESLSTLRPWLVAQSLEGADYVARGRIGKTAENVITNQARAAGHEIRSEFPHMEDAFAWMGMLTPSQEVQFLRYTLDQILSPETEIGKLDAWARGDLAPAIAFLDHVRGDYPEFYATALVARNRGWTPRIQAMLNSRRPTFAVLGMYHMVGPDSVLEQLRMAGLEPKRLR